MHIPKGKESMFRVRILGLTLTLVVLATCARCLAEPAINYTSRIWQMQDGLPEETVQAFAQTKDRYLWIGTTGGLLRFDGARLVLFDRDNTPAFTDNNVFSLTVTQDDALWIATEGGGLIRHKDGVFRLFSVKDGLLNDFVRAVYQDSKGQVWIGTDNGLFQFWADRIKRIDNSNGIPAVAVHAIHEDSQGRLWAGGSKLFSLQGSFYQEYRLAGEGSQNRVKSITQTRDGTIWVGTIGGLYRKVLGTDSFRPVRETSGTVRFLQETSDGTLWIGTIGHGIYKYWKHEFSQMTAPGSLPSNTALNSF